MGRERRVVVMMVKGWGYEVVGGYKGKGVGGKDRERVFLIIRY